MIGKERAVRFEGGKGFVWQTTWHINRNPMTHKTKVVQASEMDIWFTMVYPLPVYHSTVNESANYAGVGKNTKHHNYIGNSQRPVIHNWGYDLMEFSQTTIYHMKPSSEQPTGASYWNKSNTHCPSYFAKFKRPSTSMRFGCCIAKLRNCHPSPPVSHGVPWNLQCVVADCGEAMQVCVHGNVHGLVVVCSEEVSNCLRLPTVKHSNISSFLMSGSKLEDCKGSVL